MKVETKYQLGDDVFILFDNKIVKGYIRGITVYAEYNNNVYVETYDVRDKTGAVYSVDVAHVFYDVNSLIETFNL